MLEVPELAGGNPQLQKAMNKLVQAEEKPLKKIDEKLGLEDNKLKLVKDFKGKATEARDAAIPFKSPKDFRELIGTSSHPDLLQVSNIDKNIAELGSYDIEVVQLAMSNSISTYGFPDKDKTEVGIGYISFETGTGEKKDVYINSENNTLEGVARAINAAKVGVKAYCVDDGSDADEPYRLIITGEKTGWKNDISWPEFNMLDGDLDLDIDRTREAQSAIIKFNGEPLMVDENKVKELLPGVTFDLKRAKQGETIKMEIKPDYEKIEKKASTLMEKLNGVLSFIQNQNQLDANSRKDPSKALGGDVMLHAVESRLRSIIQKTENALTETQIRKLSDIGVTFNRGGTLDYDGKKFQAALEKNFDEVVAFFVGDQLVGGFAQELVAAMDGVVKRGEGMAAIRESGLESRIKGLNREKEQKTEKAQERIERTKVQLAKVESSIQKMQNLGGPGGMASLFPQGGGQG